ncbi:MAG: ABC transporter transmembrane domain-containing protein [Pseudomonadota bacterium]
MAVEANGMGGPRFHPLKRLLPFMRPYSYQLMLAGAVLLIAAITALVLPIAVGRIIDLGFIANDQAAVNHYFFVMLILAFILGVFTAARYYLVSWVGERVVADLRSGAYARAISLDPSYFESKRSGETLSRLTTDTTLVQAIAGVNLSITLRSVVTLVGGLTMLAVTSPKLTGLIVAVIPVVLIPLFVFGRRVRHLSRDTQDRVADTAGIAGETLNALQVVQSFNLQPLQSERYDDAVERSFVTSLRRIRARALLTAAAIIIIFCGIVLVLRVGAGAVFDGALSPGQLGQFLIYAMIVAGSCASLSEMWGEVQRATGAIERLMELLGETPSIVAPANPTSVPSNPARLSFDDVSFEYPTRPGEAALENFSLEIARGETVALVGPSAAGKSTVMQLLLRFYDPTEGAIRLDGIDLREFEPHALRQTIGIVPQDTVVFAQSALVNIRYGKPDASDAEVYEAAAAAGADEFIRRLPDGYATYLGERGVRLSGGQRQRIAIARAFLKQPAIMLLDEATSALDARTEREVQTALDALMQGRTTIVVAHRLATIHCADRIIVLDSGKIVATGDHQDLIQRDGLYAELSALQYRS